MSIAFRLIVVLIFLLPATFLAAPPIAQSCIGLGAALVLACVAFQIRATDVEIFRRALGRLTWIALIPAVWILLQLLPLPFGNASIWVSADEVLKTASWGHGTIDIGQTSMAFLFYLALLALTAVTILLSSDRERARALLVSATVTTIALVAILIGVRLLATANVASVVPSHARDALGAASVIGLMLSIAASSLRASTSGQFITRDRVVSTAAIAISVAGLALAGRLALILIAALGLGTYLAVGLARRLGARRYAAWIMLASLTLIVISALAFDAHSRMTVLTLIPATNTTGLSSAQRALADAGLSGMGAGTYQAVLPIYQGLGEGDTRPPSTLVALAIELGLPATILVLLLASAPLVMLIDGAVTRIRDSVFATAAAACLAAATAQAFIDASLASYPALPTLLAIVLGIGLAQRLRRGNAAGRR